MSFEDVDSDYPRISALLFISSDGDFKLRFFCELELFHGPSISTSWRSDTILFPFGGVF